MLSNHICINKLYQKGKKTEMKYQRDLYKCINILFNDEKATFQEDGVVRKKNYSRLYTGK